LPAVRDYQLLEVKMTTFAVHPKTNPYYLPRIDSIPYEIQRKLPRSALVLYQVLKDIHDRAYNPTTGKSECMPSYARLAAIIKVHINTIYTAVHKLQACNLISHYNRWDPVTRRFRTNMYFIPKLIYETIKTAWQTVKNRVFRTQDKVLLVVPTNSIVRKNGLTTSVRPVLPLRDEEIQLGIPITLDQCTPELQDAWNKYKKR